MASGSTMAAVNAPDSRDSSLTPPPQERNTTGKDAQRRTRQRGLLKNPLSLHPAANRWTADQTFHEEPTKLVSDSQLENEVANLERQVSGAKKAALQRQPQSLTVANPATLIEEPAANLRQVRNSKFGLFYKYEAEESQLVPLMRDYCSVDIQYVRDIKRNKFKPENIMKLSTSVRRTREAAKNLKIGTSGLEIDAKEEDCITADAKGIIPLL